MPAPPPSAKSLCNTQLAAEEAVPNVRGFCGVGTVMEYTKKMHTLTQRHYLQFCLLDIK